VNELLTGQTLSHVLAGGLLPLRKATRSRPPAVSLPRTREGSQPVQTSTDKRFLFVGDAGVPDRIDRLDLATGQRIPWKTLRPEDPASVYVVQSMEVTPDGQAYAYRYQRYLQDLYVVEGLR
jgi:hypothetical protein